MATGDILAVRILGSTATCGASGNGWIAEIDLDGLAAGGSYSLGYGTDNDPSGAKIVLTVTSPGYDTSGSTTTIQRTVYGTRQVRKIYPNHAQLDESTSGGTLTVRVALSDFIYSVDTVTATIASGFYTGSNAVSGLSCTNGSTQAYPTSIGRWAWPVQYDRVTGNFTLEAVIFNRHARNGKPLAAVKFTVTDGTNSVNYTVTDMTVSAADAGDQYSVLVYAATVNVSTLTQGQTLTCNFEAYPWVGDSGSVLKSDLVANGGVGIAQPSERLGPLELLCDKTGAYSGAFVVVDPTNGQLSNATTWVYTSRAAAEAAYASANTNSYRTAGYAFDALKAWNNANKGHNDPGGGTVLLVGSYTWNSTGRYAASGTMKTWVTVTRLSTVAKASAIWAGDSSSFLRTLRLKLEDISIGGASTLLSDDATTNNALWLHNTAFNNSFDGSVLGWTVAYATKNTVTAFRNGFAVNSATKCPWALVRGNIMPTATTPSGTRNADLYCVVGNKNVKLRPRAHGDTSGAFRSENSIAAFNASFSLTGPWATAAIANTGATAISNVAIIQNVVETHDGSGGEPQLVISGDVSTETPVNNVLLWFNTFAGQRTNLAYNDGNLASPAYRFNWALRGNNFDDVNVVTDTDTHGGYSPSAGRHGNYSTVYGAGLAGNAFYNRTATGAANSYSPLFAGILGHVGSNENPQYTTNASYTGTAAGGGDYHLTASSPALNFIRSGAAVLPYDIEGTARRNDGTGAAGAYEYVSPSNTFTYSPSGGLTLAGSAEKARTFSPSASGGLALAGSADLAKVKAYEGSGGLTAGGTALIARTKAAQVSGGAAFGGSAATSFIPVGTNEFVYAVSGGLGFAGSAAVSRTKAWTASGGFALAGSAVTLYEDGTTQPQPGRMTVTDRATGNITIQ